MSMHQSNQGCLEGLPGLPTELLMLIGEQLPTRCLKRFARVNRRIYEALVDLVYRRNIYYSGSSALLWATRKNHVEVVCRMLRLGADFNTTDRVFFERENSSTFQGMERTGSSRSEMLSLNSEVVFRKVSSLVVAVWTGNLRLVKILSKAGAGVDPPARLTFPAPLAVSMKRGDIPISRVLVNALKDINACVVPGWTAVEIASKYQQVEILKHLLEKGAIPTITDEVFTELLAVDDPRREWLQQYFRGNLDYLDEIVHRYRINDRSLEILRLLMHHALEPSGEQKRRGQTHSDPRVRYLFHDPQNNRGMGATGSNGDSDGANAQEALKDDFPPISPDTEASSVTKNSLWNDAKMHELKRSFAPSSKPLHNTTMKHPLSKSNNLTEEHNLSEEHTHADKHTPTENHTPTTSDPFPPLRPIPPENKTAIESQSHFPTAMEAKNAHKDPLNNWKTFRENITMPKTSPIPSEPSRPTDKRKKKKGKWTVLEL